MIIQRLVCCMFVAGIGMLAGCEAASYVAQGVFPDPKIKAAYELDPRTTLVLVDDPGHVLPGWNDRGTMHGHGPKW